MNIDSNVEKIIKDHLKMQLFDDLVKTVKQAIGLFTRMQADIASQRSLIEKRLASVRDGIDGKDGAPGRDGRDGKNGKDGKDGAPGQQGQQGPQGEKGDAADVTDIAAFGAAARDGLEILQGENRLKADAISGLDEKLTELRTLASQRIQTPAKAYMVYTKDASAQCNGVTTQFTVGGTHRGIVGVFSTEFPQIYRPVIDYTETSTGILLTSQVSAPQTGQSLIIQFLK